MIPASLLTVIVAAALLAPWISPQNPYDLATLRLEDSYLSPAWTEEGQEEREKLDATRWSFPLGSDKQGRDVYSAVLYGLRMSLFVGASGTAVALSIGTLVGLFAGYFRGWPDAILMRAADVQLSFPSVLIALFLMAVWGAGLTKIIIAVGVVHWVLYARIARGVVLLEREKDYIAAVRSLGARAPRIMLRHLLPNTITPILVVSVVQFASIVILEATLSYLGLGVPPTEPSLGTLINNGYDDFFSGRWWVWFFPGFALMSLMLAINWLGDLLRTEFQLEG